MLVFVDFDDDKVGAAVVDAVRASFDAGVVNDFIVDVWEVGFDIVINVGENHGFFFLDNFFDGEGGFCWFTVSKANLVFITEFVFAVTLYAFLAEEAKFVGFLVSEAESGFCCAVFG